MSGMSAEGTVYPRAPITEAVLDIRVEPREGIDIDTFKLMTEQLKSEYPVIAERHQGEASISIGPNVTTTPHFIDKTVGYLARVADGDRAYQVHLNGFSVNKYTPYRNWTDLKTQAQKIWPIYRDAAKPKSVVRLALRYINRIDIPSGTVELGEYFRTTIDISADLPQAVSAFFFQIQLPQPDIGSLCVINSTGVPPPSTGITSIILDIDLFKSGDVPQSEEEMWLFFDQLRLRKNKIFESCITDRAREMFR